ncbi:hypothetical protein MGN70_013759 [Eutypa lata]|nr:hypothetical protein MGN70_013759 [Eutypa lata]
MLPIPLSRKQQIRRKLNPSQPQTNNIDPLPQKRGGGRRATAPNPRIRLDPSLKWLMVRQLWLWKLDDNTIITSIPSRRNGMVADSLLETIRQGNLNTLRTPEDLIKSIVHDAVTFLDEFKWAGLGEHILDIFDEAIALEREKEVQFFEEFPKIDGNITVHQTVQEAAKSTLLVKDIRDELRLLRQVFETQLKVVEDFAEAFWPSKHVRKLTQEKGPETVLRESFIHDSGLASLMRRVTRMDEEASTTLEGLSNIIQAMQAQASLKEAEAARVMNLIILPFTVVTVIFSAASLGL